MHMYTRTCTHAHVHPHPHPHAHAYAHPHPHKNSPHISHHKFADVYMKMYTNINEHVQTDLDTNIHFSIHADRTWKSFTYKKKNLLYDIFLPISRVTIKLFIPHGMYSLASLGLICNRKCFWNSYRIECHYLEYILILINLSFILEKKSVNHPAKMSLWFWLHKGYKSNTLSPMWFSQDSKYTSLCLEIFHCNYMYLSLECYWTSHHV